MANPEHVRIVKQGRKAAAEWRKDHPRATLQLSRSSFVGADLSGADLHRANLSAADLSGADLFEASLESADLRGAKLRGAVLIGANLSLANLTEADLTGAALEVANLTGAEMLQTKLHRTRTACTVFGGCDLSQCAGLDSVEHAEPDVIGVDTLTKSFRGAGNRLTPELRTFFLGAGVPKELLDELPRILAGVKYCSCFISYGEPDRAFAEKLKNDLVAKGASCWVYSMDATPGERTWREIGEKRRGADKTVVLCSAQALNCDGVLKEIEEQIDEEPDKMVPVSLDNEWNQDNYWLRRRDSKLGVFLRDRNYADFSGAVPYEQALERLLKALERKQG